MVLVLTGREKVMNYRTYWLLLKTFSVGHACGDSGPDYMQ